MAGALASLARRFRADRNKHFAALLATVKIPARILDIGGTERYWEQIAFADHLQECAHVTLLNLTSVPCRRSNFKSIAGDARDLGAFADRSFDVVFSNSVIEHVGTANDQARMASEIRRVGKRYYVQTPNRYFLIEPHFLLPLFQFYPAPLKECALRHVGLSVTDGRVVRRPVRNRAEAQRLAESIRLLTKAELRRLFPGADLWAERIGPFAKSYVVHDGWRT